MATRQRPPVDAGRRHASRSRGFLSAGFSLLVLVALLPSPAGAVKEVAFADIDPAKPDQVVLMHRSGEDASASALAALKDAESRVKASGVAGTERLEFIACDAAGGDSGDGMERKGLVSLPALFVAVKDQGRDRYLRELSGEKLSEYIQGKFQVSAEDDVFPFDRDLISDEYPVLVKFHERWCTRYAPR
ncbi:hypothetical protein T484DRAFT_2591243 [Baffinella frigidus]|nr:hypothetical protein T484DRAFT_2591243 [Cryptophyta sp. CCMP2293]